MTPINEYLSEGLNVEKHEPEVDQYIYNLLNNISADIIKSLRPYNENDINSYAVQHENEKTIIDSISSDKYQILTLEGFYNKTHDNTFDYLSKKEKTEFDRNNGDIIFVDENNNPVYCIDLKVSNTYLGAVNMGSLSYFKDIAKKQHIYFCANLKNGNKKIINHDTLYNAVVADEIKLCNPMKNHPKGYIVNDKELGTQYSECFVKGKDIDKYFK